jgi:eukaryotic-like serine/threonine-protein kinase
LGEPVAEPSANFGRYQLIAALGHGGMANVYLAVARGKVGFNKLQVIKCLRPNLADEAEFLRMFLDEARLAARLNHPNVVQTNEIDELDGNYFIAMEYLDGQPLNRILRRARQRSETELTIEARVGLLVDALAGLHYAHELADYDGTPLAVVHRDASPHNIFVTYDGQVKVVDFGIAKAASHSGETRTGVLKGKVAYMSPEQAACDAVDRRADVFAMGVVLAELLTGERLWAGKGDLEVLHALMNHDKLPSMVGKADLPEGLVAIVERATAMSPEDRYPDAEAMRQDLLEWLAADGRSRPNRDDVGGVVSALFGDERTKLRALIDRQLGAIAAGAAGSVDFGGTLGGLPTLSHSSLDSGQAKGSDSRPTLSQVALAEGTASRPGPRKLAGAVIGALALGGVLAIFALGDDDSPARKEEPGAAAPSVAPPPEETASASEAEAAMPPPATERTVQIEIKARPAHAVIVVDGEEKTGNPFRGVFPVDEADHQVEIVADGYATEQRTIRFDHNLRLDVALVREPRGRTVVMPPPTTKGAQPPPPSTGGPGAPKKREVDSTDPWQ